MNEKSTLEWIWTSLTSYLQKRGLKQTHQRKIIIEHFLKINGHVDAETLHTELKKTNHNIGLATIYRTLTLLRQAGLVEQLNHSEGGSTYELKYPGDHHDHLVCLNCSKIEEFESSKIEELQKQIAKQRGFSLTFHRLDLFGYCQECKNKKES